MFCRAELKYLGYIVNGSGLHVDPEKIKAILDIPIPKTVSEVRRMIGISSWYRRFVRDYGTLVVPLTNLLRKNRPFIWTKECEVAWAELKECEVAWAELKERLVTAPVLVMPDFEREFVIQADASHYGIGAVLTQNFDEGEKVIAYISKSLSLRERNFSTTEKKCLAVLFAIEKFRPYVEGAHFTVVTDHYSLLWLNSLHNPSGRLARWAVRLQQYDFTIVHRKGKEHLVPDALSRAVPIIDALQDSVTTNDKWYRRLVDGVPHKLIRSPYPDLVESSTEWKRVIPKELRDEMIRKCHDEPTSGHLGIFKTANRILEKAYWPALKADVARYIRKCRVCMKAKPLQRAPTGRMGGHSLISRPWQVLSADIVGPLPKTSRGHQYIFVVSDCFSKFALFFPLRKATAPALVKHLEDSVFLQYGVPEVLISDNGVQFRSKE
ncbi:Integrase zinc binding domain [Popillia japonica]|uniref:RNA-directed DNA polymerase n=1 Tax=Popillia japonica TaxID=7064 RepID=A0AAW1LBQ5_POPJA